MINWPKPFTQTIPFTDWLNKLLAGVKRCEIQSGQGYKVRQTTNGTVLDIANFTPGKVIYLHLCRADGTECYVPMRVEGTIYTDLPTTYTAPTIDPGAVPENAEILS